MKNCIRPPDEKLKSLKSGFIENSNFENNRDPCLVPLKVSVSSSMKILISSLCATLSVHQQAEHSKIKNPRMEFPTRWPPQDLIYQPLKQNQCRSRTKGDWWLYIVHFPPWSMIINATSNPRSDPPVHHDRPWYMVGGVIPPKPSEQNQSQGLFPEESPSDRIPGTYSHWGDAINLLHERIPNSKTLHCRAADVPPPCRSASRRPVGPGGAFEEDPPVERSQLLGRNKVSQGEGDRDSHECYQDDDDID